MAPGPARRPPAPCSAEPGQLGSRYLGVPDDLTPRYTGVDGEATTLKATWKKAVAKSKVTVHDSSLSLSAVNFTISKSATTAPPSMTGTVKFKGNVATTGYVDIYKNGNVKGGSGSPDYCCMAGVDDAGAFDFSGYSFLDRVADKEAPGTYSYQAFYTDDSGFVDYNYSSPIVVNVVP